MVIVLNDCLGAMNGRLNPIAKSMPFQPEKHIFAFLFLDLGGKCFKPLLLHRKGIHLRDGFAIDAFRC